MMEPDVSAAQAVVELWRAAGWKRWFTSSLAFDAEIEARFGNLHRDASDGKLDDWIDTPIGALALVLLLDQFSRNLHRNSPLAFANDRAALAVAAEAIKRGHDLMVDVELQPFLYLPFEHAEEPAAQDRSVELAGRYRERTGEAEPLKWAVHHREIIRRFGRFPHRNAVLERSTSDAERAFMDSGGFAG